MNKNNKVTRGPGRPKYEPRFPKTLNWTMVDWMEANEIETNRASKKFGKGPKCSLLTLNKFKAKDAKHKNRSMIVKLKDVTADPNSKSGLERKQLVYSLRSRIAS